MLALQWAVPCGGPARRHGQCLNGEARQTPFRERGLMQIATGATVRRSGLDGEPIGGIRSCGGRLEPDDMSIWHLGRALCAITGHRLRSVLTFRGLRVGIAAVTCTVGVSTAPSSASPQTAWAARCWVGTGGPVIKYPTIYAFGRFCDGVSRTDTVTVVLQGRVRGKWTRITGVSKKLHMRAGTTYIVRTPPIHCTAHPHSIRMRTYVAITQPPHGRTFLVNSGIPTYCI